MTGNVFLKLVHKIGKAECELIMTTIIKDTKRVYSMVDRLLKYCYNRLSELPFLPDLSNLSLDLTDPTLVASCHIAPESLNFTSTSGILLQPKPPLPLGK